MRHAREELGLVLAGHFQLAALHLDLAEESRIQDSQDGLGRESLEEIHDVGGRPSGLLAPDHEHADDPLLEEKRNRQQRPIPSPLEDGADARDVVRPFL